MVRNKCALFQPPEHARDDIALPVFGWIEEHPFGWCRSFRVNKPFHSTSRSISISPPFTGLLAVASALSIGKSHLIYRRTRRRESRYFAKSRRSFSEFPQRPPKSLWEHGPNCTINQALGAEQRARPITEVITLEIERSRRVRARACMIVFEPY
jgi:hypothetical protein